MLEKEIVISKGNILKQYTNLNNNIKSIIEKFYELKEFDKEYQLSANLNITAIKVEDFVKDNKIQNEKFIDKAPEIDFNKLQNIILKYTLSLI